MSLSDSQFEADQDARLRAVAVPEGLLDRCRRTVLLDDEGLDATLRDVPIPGRMLDRLRQCVLIDDQGLDAAIRDVPIPHELPDRLQRGPKARIRLARLTQWATAVSLLLAIGISYLGAMFGFLVTTYPRPAAVDRPELKSQLTFELSELPKYFEWDLRDLISPPDGMLEEDLVADSSASRSKIELLRMKPPGPTPLAELDHLFHGPGMDPFSEPYGWTADIEATHSLFDKLPELKKVHGPIPRGIDPPLVPGFNWPFYLGYGVNPPVAPSAHPKLRESVVPLEVDSASYELTRRYLEDRELPPPKDIRTEEFLAAVDYGFPPPSQQALALSTAGGPSAFGSYGALLLQIGVQTRRLHIEPHPPAHLVVAVDTSTSMRWGGRLEMVRRAMNRLIEHLAPEDRISLVTFSERADLLIAGAGRDDREQLLAAVKSLAVEGSTNLGAGLSRAYTLTQHNSTADRAADRVVLLSDGLTEIGPRSAELIEQQLSDAAAEGIHLDVIDLGQENDPDFQLARFAKAAGGKVHRVGNADQVHWTLLEILTGSSQLVAEDARLKVTFNPQTVLAYRLFGHEAKSIAGLMPAHPEADFHAGGSATALYEVWLKPNSGIDVAVVELQWREPGTQTTQTLTRQVRRAQFAPSFVRAAASLQAAALVAEAAEVLRDSPFAPLPENSRTLALARVSQLAGYVHTELHSRPTFVEFLSLTKQAEGARFRRKGGSRR